MCILGVDILRLRSTRLEYIGYRICLVTSGGAGSPMSIDSCRPIFIEASEVKGGCNDDLMGHTWDMANL
jgi:hypothetical protein